MIKVLISCPFSPQKRRIGNNPKPFSNIDAIAKNVIMHEAKLYDCSTNHELKYDEFEDYIIDATQNTSSILILAIYKKYKILLEFKEAYKNLTILTVTPIDKEKKFRSTNIVDLGWYVDFAITLTYGYTILSLETTMPPEEIARCL